MKAKSGSKRKHSEKLISRNIKYACRLYYAYPSEVVSALLEFFHLNAPEYSANSDLQQADGLDLNQSGDAHNQIASCDMKIIITKFSEKEPRLMLAILKSVVEMTQTLECLETKGESNACMPAKMKNLCSLVLWLVTNIKELKDSGCIGLVHEIGVLSSDRNAVPLFLSSKTTAEVVLSTIGERCLIDAALLLIEMASNNVKEKLMKLPMLSLGKFARNSTLPESSKETESFDKATEELEMFKSQLKQKDASLAENGTGGSLNTIMPEKRNRWSITKSWTPVQLEWYLVHLVQRPFF